MGGCAYYLVAHHHGQLVLLPFAIITSTFLISYQRSKAESLGLSAKGGLMERAERMILLGVALLANVLFIPVLWLMLALTTMTALGRFVRVWSSADRPVLSAESSPHKTTTHSYRRRLGLSRSARN
jgi:CDP-diacylglycerol--glycerol-3-phosphate 3-phosphatidyltransferase